MNLILSQDYYIFFKKKKLSPYITMFCNMFSGQVGRNKEHKRKRLNKVQCWNSLSHNGVMFPLQYVPHGKPVIYDGKHVPLSPKQEEVSTPIQRDLD
jgi:hypothetical protein